MLLFTNVSLAGVAFPGKAHQDHATRLAAEKRREINALTAEGFDLVAVSWIDASDPDREAMQKLADPLVAEGRRKVIICHVDIDGI